MAAGLIVAAAITPTAAAAAASSPALIGTFRIAAASCASGAATGSSFRMVLPSGTTNGPFVSNNDSACGDKTYTPLAPGTDGGIVTGAYQAEPSPGFDGNGNSLAALITKPVTFYGVAFSTSTNSKDPQTGTAVSAPSLSAQAGKLTGDLRAFAASWNRQDFNQGAPKPDGSTPGNTSGPTGTYDAATHHFTLTWASQIQGGPFNNFTGVWHLEGTFVPSASPSVAPPSSTPSQSPGLTKPTSPATTGAAVPTAPPSAPDIAAPSTPDSSPTATTTTSLATRAVAASASKRGGPSSNGPVTVVALLLVVIAGATVSLWRFRGRWIGRS